MHRATAFAASAVLSLAPWAGTTSGQAARPELSYQKDAFRHIAGELQDKRVVSLADFAHGNAYPYHTLLQVLSNWLDLAASTSGRLVLAMEMDAEATEILREYLRTEDREPVLEYWLPFSSLDQLAFYDDLREFVLRVQRINEGLAEDRKVGFHVLGLETFSMWASGNTLAGLRLITGQPFETAAQWQQWATQNPYDGLARMDSDEFTETIRLACVRPVSRQRNTMLMSLGLPLAYCIRQQQISPEQWRGLWPKLSSRIKFLQCVGIYGIGCPAEREKAGEYMVQFSSQKFESPARYLEGYRKACLGLTY